MLQSHDIINNSSRDITQTFDVKKTITSSYTFGFSKTVRTFGKLSVKAGISLNGNSNAPLGNGGSASGNVSAEASVGAEGSLEVSVQDNQQWTTTTEDSFSINQVVTIPSFRSITVDGIIQMAEDVEVPFVAQILVSMSNRRLTRFSRAIVRETLPRWQIRGYLQRNVQGRIIQDTEDGILFETNGTLRGTFGVSTVLHVKEFPVLNRIESTP